MKPPEFHLENGFFILTVWRKQKLIKTFTQPTGEVAGEVTGEVAGEVTGEVIRLLKILVKEPLPRSKAQSLLKVKGQANFRERYVEPALKSKLIEMTIPDKPNNRLQKYRITSKGLQILRKKGAK